MKIRIIKSLNIIQNLLKFFFYIHDDTKYQIIKFEIYLGSSLLISILDLNYDFFM